MKADWVRVDEDVQRMLAFRDGDVRAFDVLFQRWSAPLLRYLERMVRDAGTAEELVQEAFLRVYRARARYVPEARFATWLYKIATRLALNELRRPARRAPHRSADDAGAHSLPDAGPSVDAVVDARRRRKRVESELATLPERQRAALWLTAVEGLSYAEVSETLEVSEQAVKALVHRARSALVGKLKRADRDVGRTGDRRAE
jgi:RNA polymerase sigma-70 factor (ECF subfamily)